MASSSFVYKSHLIFILSLLDIEVYSIALSTLTHWSELWKWYILSNIYYVDLSVEIERNENGNHISTERPT